MGAVYKVAAVATSLAAAAPSLFSNDLTTPIIGVGISTVAGAVLGTYAAIGYDEESKPRGKLFALATATVIIASAATGVVPQAIGWFWVNQTVEGGAAALCAVIVYFTLPPGIIRARELIRNFKFSDLIPFRKVAPTPPSPEPGPTGDSDK